MTDDNLPQEPALGFVLLGKQTLMDATEAAGKHGILAVAALLWYADNDTGRCHPSLTALARRAGGITVRTMRETLRKLRAAELITWVDRSDEGKPHLFTITQTIHTRATVGPVEKDTGGGRKRQARGVAKTPGELDPDTPKLFSRRTRAELALHFGQFWDQYGRKDTSKKRAWEAWNRAGIGGELPGQADLLNQVERYRRHTFKGRPEDKARQFLKHPERWLREQCYLSEYPDTYQGGPGAGGRLQPAYQPGEAGEEPTF